MAPLAFAYVASARATWPDSIATALPRRQWSFTRCEPDAVGTLTSQPDFMWVNLGPGPRLPEAEAVLKSVAQLHSDAEFPGFVFISGTALPEKAHKDLVERIYELLPPPLDVVADLVGQPDVAAAIARFHAFRKARPARVETRTAPPAPAFRVPNADLRSARGRLSIKAIAKLFGLDVIEVGRLIGRKNKATLSKTPDAESLQEPLQPFADIALLRAPDFGDEQFRKWLRARNEHLGNRSPLDWIRDGRVQDVGGFVLGILTGDPT